MEKEDKEKREQKSIFRNKCIFAHGIEHSAIWNIVQKSHSARMKLRIII